MTTDTDRRPDPLTPTGIQAPDGRWFPWGPIDAIHRIGRFEVVEYRQDYSNYSQPETWHKHGHRSFHPYIDGRDTSRSYSSLESALVGAIAYDRAGPNSQAARHFDLITLGSLPDGGDS